MPANDERWLDAEAGPVVRPYALTQGRTRHAGESFDLVATVMATPVALTEPGADLGLVAYEMAILVRRSGEHIRVSTRASALSGWG